MHSIDTGWLRRRVVALIFHKGNGNIYIVYRFFLIFFEWRNIFRDFSNVYALFVYLCAEKLRKECNLLEMSVG